MEFDFERELFHPRVVSKGDEKTSAHLLSYVIHKPIRGVLRVITKKRESFPPNNYYK